MNAKMRRCAGLIVLSMLLSTTRQAKADSIQTDATLIIVGVAAAATAITVGIVLVVTHKPSMTGCVAQDSGGLTLHNEADSKSYVLRGDTTSIKPGQRVKVRGRHVKNNSAEFDVVELKKSYGECPAAAHS